MTRFSRRLFLASAAAISASSLIGLHKAVGADGFVQLTARPAQLRFGAAAGPVSDLIGYNGSVPGPELRFTRGQPIRIRYHNEIDAPTTVHWHGIRLANAMDGVPGLTQAAVPPGGRFDYEFIAPDAGTFWYHAHINSWNQVARGLFGALIIDEPLPAFDRDRDHTLVLTDWRLDAEGRFDAASLGSSMDWSHAGRIGAVVTVNGTAEPMIGLSADDPHRLRLINTGTSRVLKLSLAGAPATIIARDGQATARRPFPDKFVLGPAQRVDLLVVPDRGSRPELLETSEKPLVLARFDANAPGTGLAAPVLTAPRLLEPDLGNARVAPLLMQGGALGKLNGVEVAEMRAGMDMPAGDQPLWAFNDVSGMGETPLFQAKQGETIRIDMVNDTAWDHAIHIHGHHFRVISRKGIASGDPAWFDTVMIAPGETLQAAFVADNPGDWMIHCHMLEHSVSGMDTWFRVG